jgi:hypothetical protein
VSDLPPEEVLFVLIELLEGFKARGVLSDEGSLLQDGGLVLDALVAGESLDFGEELVAGNTLERIADPVRIAQKS